MLDNPALIVCMYIWRQDMRYMLDDLFFTTDFHLGVSYTWLLDCSSDLMPYHVWKAFVSDIERPMYGYGADGLVEVYDPAAAQNALPNRWYGRANEW